MKLGSLRPPARSSPRRAETSGRAQSYLTGLASAWLLRVIGPAAGFLLTPYILAKLGREAFGAYAVRLNLSTNASGIADSDDFFIVYNFGLGDTEFEEGVEAFAALVPEPATMMLLPLGAMSLWFYRITKRPLRVRWLPADARE